MKERRFQCSYCGKHFALEDRFMQHKCKEMIRDEEFRSPIGQSAWLFYQEWMKQHRRQVPPSSTFLKSKFYSAFVKFAKFVKQTALPNPNMFIWLMKEKDLAPALWITDPVYSMYLEFIDRKGDPIQQVETTIDTLFEIQEAAECEISEIFDVLTPNEVIQLLRQRRISPWLLLHSKKFFHFMLQKASNEERTILETIIRPQYWQVKFQQNPEAINKIKKYVAELNL